MNVVSEDDTLWIKAQHQTTSIKLIVNIDKNKINVNFKKCAIQICKPECRVKAKAKGKTFV